MKTSRVAVVIPCRNEYRYIVNCIQSVLNQDYPGDLLNVYVVDGQSDDGTLDIIAKEFCNNKRVQVIDNPQRTTPYALNRGIQVADADVSIIFGAHAIMLPHYVTNCVELLEKDPSAGCVGGVIENVNENESARYISQCMSSAFGVGNAHFRTGNASGYVDTVAFGAYRREVFQQVGYFDEALTRNQDDEYNFRLTKCGWKIILDQSIRSQYFVRGSYSKLARQYYQYGYWKVYVNILHQTITTVRQLIPFAFVSYLIAAVIMSILCPSWWYIWSVPAFLYFLMALLVSIRWDRSLKGIIHRAFVFLILHVSYGWGYLRGMIRFLILRQRPGQHASKTSR
ncbi:MAG: hypothetical protein RLZZ262_952 [Bacteroidota bacterium]|jgi:GT2 family glycosyltransferase